MDGLNIEPVNKVDNQGASPPYLGHLSRFDLPCCPAGARASKLTLPSRFGGAPADLTISSH